MTYTIQLRRDTAARWTFVNPTLADGEPGYEKDTGKVKIGDGNAPWAMLPYFGGSGGGGGGGVLTLPLAVSQGGTGQASAQAAVDALTAPQQAGAGTYLRSDGAHATLALLAAADIPQLAAYTPGGLVSGGIPTSYAGGSPPGGGHPAGGTWTAGQWVIDPVNRLIWICVTGGTPGVWKRAGTQPWQFFLDDYGCRGDGRQALVTTTAGSAVITTTPLPAPAAPAPATATAGGTIPAGTYSVIITYVNRWGETTGSAPGTATTTGATSTITVPSPAPTRNATGWYAYMTQAGGTAYTRQQPAGAPTPIEESWTRTAPPSAAGAAPPAADSSAAQVFTGTTADGGKDIMICGGLGSPGGPWTDTIASVQSPVQATLASNGASQGGNVTQPGCGMIFSTDDRLAVDACIADARAYALANNNFAQVIGSDRNYGLGKGVFQSLPADGGLQYNTQLRWPIGHPSGQAEKLEMQLLGPGDNAHAEFWVSQLANLAGCCFISYAAGPAAPDPVYGQQSVIGAPQGGANFNGSNGFANATAVIRGVQVLVPGWHNTIGIDLQWVSGFILHGSVQAFAPTTSIGGGVNPSSGWLTNSFWQAKAGVGLRTPNALNNDDCVVESFATEGVVTSVSCGADHLVVTRLVTINTYFGLRVTGGDSNTHDLTITQWSFENVTGGVLQCQAGAAAHIKVNITMDGENPGPLYDIQDNANALYGVVRWSDPFRAAGGPANVIAPIVQGAANLEIINGHLPRQVYGAPAYTLGTAFQNPWWRHMTLTLAGGTVTGISIGPSAAALTSLGVTAGTFRLPSGWWLLIAGSVKPATFTAVPD